MGTLLLLPKSLAGSTKTPFQDSALYCVVPAATGKCGWASVVRQVLALQVLAHLTPRRPAGRRSGSSLCRLGSLLHHQTLS